jgi:hypothetical protein
MSRAPCSVAFALVKSTASAPWSQAFPPKLEGGIDNETRRMTRSFSFKQLVSWRAGAVITLLALVLLAPPVAKGGCSHLVTSRTDPGRLSPLIGDLSGRSEGIPVPSRPRPCSGAFCSQQPAAPAVPAIGLDQRLDSWPWCPILPTLASARPSFLSAGTIALCPVQRAGEVFHPPRLLLSA